MAVERRFNPPQVSKMLVKWSKCSSFYSQRTSKRKSLIISDIFLFFILSPFLLVFCHFSKEREEDHDYFQVNEPCFLDKPSSFQYNYPLRGSIIYRYHSFCFIFFASENVANRMIRSKKCVKTPKTRWKKCDETMKSRWKKCAGRA